MRVFLLILALVLGPALGNAAVPQAHGLSVHAEGHCQPSDHHGATHAPTASDSCKVNCAAGGMLVIPPDVPGLAAYGLPVSACRAIDDISPDLLSWPPPRKPPRS